MFAGGVVIDQLISNQNERNALVATANKKLDAEIAEIKDLKEQINALKARQKAVEDLQSDRTIPVHLFDELVRLMPEGVFLQKLSQQGMNVTMAGYAQSNERVAELLPEPGRPQRLAAEAAAARDQGSGPEGGRAVVRPEGDTGSAPGLRVQPQRRHQEQRAAGERSGAGSGRCRRHGRRGRSEAMKSPSIDFSAVQRQFEGLQGRHPGIWPLLPRGLLLLGVVLVLVVAGWFAYWSGLIDTWNQGQATEEQLKGEYRTKVAEAVNLPELRKQKIQVEQYVGVLEKQLPSRAEMDALLRDINQARASVAARS